MAGPRFLGLAAIGSVMLGVAAPGPGLAASKAAKHNAEILADYQAFQMKDQVLQQVGLKLARGNAAYCANAPLSIGLTLTDMAGYSRPNDVRSALGLDGDFAVATAGSLAADSQTEAYQLAPDLEITAIDGAKINDWPAKKRLDWKRLKRAHDLVDASLQDNGEVQLQLGSNQNITLYGVPACATRFELKSGGKKALADGARVQLGSEFPGFAYAEDEFAAVVAHELAHNILEHRKWLDAKGRNRRAVRATEREADRLMPWLLANAGYDPRAAVRFMERWGPKHSKGIFRARTHDGWDERAEFVAAEAEIVIAHLTASGAADWPRFFRRDIAPLDDEG
ncbi:MAG: hypothetical protein ABJ242_04145 [Marinomonas sp.]